eukprot:TRINITY_DN30490_c0_g1_i2.p1 TRINITY_DN30490_c0_g1~~TRINITY_DN30490_c0_g1_i2.p1  ORF type:complete len:300 (-),score=38.80 TRINITY_DN30490_c0_g1_i2:119-1018(-)
MKRHGDLEDLHAALLRELRGVRGHQPLPSLPLARPPEECVLPGFLRELRDYLFSLSRCLEAVETYSFRNFFHMSDDYQFASKWISASGARPSSETSLDQTPRLNVSCRLGAADFAALLGGAACATGASTVSEATTEAARRAVEPARGAVPSVTPNTLSKAQPGVVGGYRDEVLSRTSRPPLSLSHLSTLQASTTQQITSGLKKTGLPPTAASEAARPDRQSPWSSEEVFSSVETTQGTVLGRPGQRRRAMCVICMAAPQEIAIDPCGHLSMCNACAAVVQSCPVCRGPIEKSLRVYIVT